KSANPAIELEYLNYNESGHSSRHCEELLRRSNPCRREKKDGLLRCARKDVARASSDLPQHRLDRLALVRRERRLRRDGIADVIALDRQPGLDAGGEVVAREGFV